MTKFLIFLILSMVCVMNNCAQADKPFDTYFEDRTLRIDYYHTADKETEIVTLDRLYMQGRWAGNPSMLLDPFDVGEYWIKVYDPETKTLIYSKGFSSYCSEYRTTDPAAKGIKQTFPETALIPFPKKQIRIVLESRDRENRLKPIFNILVHPRSIKIIKEQLNEGVKVFKFRENGDPHYKVDLAIVAEGYTARDRNKFIKDSNTMVAHFFKTQPMNRREKDFNVYGVFKASQESEVDSPDAGFYRNTAVSATFNSMGIDRYLLTEDTRALHDIAAHVPYDTIIILVNSPRYGGGGIYNFYSILTSDSPYKYKVMVHEFGHSFTCLADEYYTSSVAYQDFYPTNIEPLEANITALKDPANLKWRHLVNKDTPVPTPWEKDDYDKLTTKEGDRELQKLLPKYKNVVGAFEGAGYKSTGLYRPMLNCIMFSNSTDQFCKVCEDAIEKTINYYTKQ